MHAKLTEIIGINKVNINHRYPALNAIFIRLFLNKLSLFQSSFAALYSIGTLSGHFSLREKILPMENFPIRLQKIRGKYGKTRKQGQIKGIRTQYPF